MGYIGLHRVEEEGDVLVLTFGGDCSREEAWQILAIIDGIIKRHGRYGALVDVRRLGRVDLETRRSIAKWPGSRNCYGNAFYGASLATRTLLTLLAQGIRMFRGHNFPAAFPKTEEEARAWLAMRGAQATAPQPP